MTVAEPSPASDAARPARLRRAAAWALEQTLATLAPAEPALERAEAPFDERDRRLLRELLFESLRHKSRLEHLIERASGRSLRAIDPPLRAILIVAVTQLVLLDRVPAHAAVDLAVGEALRSRGRAAAGFVNAVLRKIAAAPRLADWPIEESDPRRRLAIETSHPLPLVERWWRRYGAESTRALLEASLAPRALHLLAFSDRGGRDRLALQLAEEGVVTRPSRLSPAGLVVESGQPLDSAAFRRGDFYIQDEASQAAALIPMPCAGDRVLDAAAAPGGKGLALIAVEPSVRLVAADRSLRRVERLRANLSRLGRALPVVVADAAQPLWQQRFDRVVLDASCSGTGTLRRHPELKWRFRRSELQRLADASLQQLSALASGVVAGGRLVHITCSIEPEENELVIDRFLDSCREFRPEPLDPAALPEGSRWMLGDGRWRALPGGGHDGFSVALLRRAR